MTQFDRFLIWDLAARKKLGSPKPNRRFNMFHSYGNRLKIVNDLEHVFVNRKLIGSGPKLSLVKPRVISYSYIIFWILIRLIINWRSGENTKCLIVDHNSGMVDANLIMKTTSWQSSRRWSHWCFQSLIQFRIFTRNP